MRYRYLCDMTEGKPTGLLLKFSIPMLIGNLFQQLYNMVDSVIVGHYVGDNALAAVGATGALNFFFFSLAFGMAAGVGVIVSQYFGAKNETGVKKAIATSIYVMTASAILMGALGILLARKVLLFMDTPENILGDSILYLRISCGGLIAIAFYNGISAILRALGDSKTPLIFLIFASVINAVLDLLFVVQFSMGVAGVAIATIIAQMTAAVGCIIYAFRKVHYMRMPLHEYVPDKRVMIQTLSIGVPIAFQNSLISVSCLVLQRIINGYGASVVAAYTASSRFEQLIHQPFTSLGVAVATFTGQNFGAGKLDRVKEGFRAAMKVSTIFAFVMLPIVYFSGRFLMHIFTKTDTVVDIGASGIRITALFYSLLGMIYMTRNLLNGIGDAKFSMVSGIVEVIGRFGFASLLAALPFLGVLGVWLANGLTWTITGIAGLIRYYWQKKHLLKANIS